jgi:hypothetical protein
MARRVEAEPLDWDDVDDDEIAEDVRAHFDCDDAEFGE